MPPHESELSRLISELPQRPEAFEDLVNAAYEELRRLAAARLRHEQAGHTLQATALVNEACLRLLSGEKLHFEGRAHFFRAVAEAMRRVLVDSARRRLSLKRGQGRPESLNDEPMLGGTDPATLLAVHEGLDRLSQDDGVAAEVVRLKFFGGLEMEEIARNLGISMRSAEREWAYAKARLRLHLDGDRDGR